MAGVGIDNKHSRGRYVVIRSKIDSLLILVYLRKLEAPLTMERRKDFPIFFSMRSIIFPPKGTVQWEQNKTIRHGNSLYRDRD